MGSLRSLAGLAPKFGKENPGNQSRWCGKVGESHSSNNLGCRRSTETTLSGYQLAELCLDRSSGPRLGGNTATWQKIPKSKQPQIRRKSRIRGLPVAEPKPEMSVQYLWSKSQSRLMLLLAGLQGGCLAAARYSVSSRGRWTGRTAVCAMTQRCDSLPVVNLVFHKKVSCQGAASSPEPLTSPALFTQHYFKRSDLIICVVPHPGLI